MVHDYEIIVLNQTNPVKSRGLGLESVSLTGADEA